MVGTDVYLVISRGVVCKIWFPPQSFPWYLLRLLETLFPPVSPCQLSRCIPRAAPTLCKLQTRPGESNLPLLLRSQLTALHLLLKIQTIGVVVFI